MQDHPDGTDFSNEDAWEEAGAMRRGQPIAFAASVDPNAPVVESRFAIDWSDGHRETRYPADTTYQNGCAIDVALDAPRACRVQLPYPAKGCGHWVVICRACDYAIALGTAGRRDDPSSVRIPCRGS